MCDTSARRAAGRPRWAALYRATFLPLAALALAEVANLPGGLRTALRCAFSLGVFAAMAIWGRSNRVARDLEHWCACAPRTITVRVIESQPVAAIPPLADLVPWAAAGADAEEEPAHR
jgi:hypothetical protein